MKPLGRTAVAIATTAAIVCALVGSGCSSSTAPTASTTIGTTALPTGTTAGAAGTKPTPQAVVDTYADLVYRSYDASVESATTLSSMIKAFLGAPTQANLDAARKQWLAARDDYGPTEAFRFYDGPIDDPDTGPEGQINAWPMDEAYVDYVEGDLDAGVINDSVGYPEITTEILVEANEQGGETNISTGWHAIEFLLWGQDNNPNGPGNRPVTDYTTAANAQRRGVYLTLLADLLVADLTAVRDAWDPAVGDNYRADFVKDPQGALADILRGIGALTAGELAGERMGVAFETKDQEDEHSCFSDNTAADVANNALGVQRVYLAQFPGVTGPSLSALVADADPTVDAKLREQIATSVKLTSNFPATFETMIQGDDASPGRKALLEAITALESQGDAISAAATALGVTVNFEV